MQKHQLFLPSCVQRCSEESNNAKVFSNSLATPIAGAKGGWGVLQPPGRGVLTPPPVGENSYICRGKQTKIWPTVPNHEKKYSPPVGEHSSSVGKFLAPPLATPILIDVLEHALNDRPDQNFVPQICSI